MTTHSVQLSIRIRAKPREVWSALVDPDKLSRWMGAHVESTWQPGSAITFTGMLNKRPYRDRGTVLVCEPERVGANKRTVVRLRADGSRSANDVWEILRAGQAAGVNLFALAVRRP